MSDHTQFHGGEHTVTDASPYRDEIDEDEAAGLDRADPNVAGADHGEDGVVNHEDHLGDFVDDDEDAALADARTAALEPDLDGDGKPDEPDGAQ